MRDLLSALLVLGMLTGVIMLMLPGRRSGGNPTGDFLARMGAPSGYFGVFLIGALACAQLIANFKDVGALGFETGLILGIVVAPVIRYRPTRTTLSIIGFIAGLMTAYRLVSSQSLPPPTGVDALDSGAFRLSLMLIVLTCFALGAGLGQMGGRSSSVVQLGGEGGLAFFGLVDLATFVAAPVGAELLGLEPDRFYVYLAIAAIGSALVGLATGPLVLWALGALLTFTSVALPLAGVGVDPMAVPAAMFAVGAIVAYLAVRWVVRKLPGL